ncbi:YccF domain-containing protein [Chitinophaga silvatica]|uniref:YccF domain-containing protein n=1 Tax=Chitinophaga silvatica TaxID=2282649 RepID=A0A3E1Y8R8_9BACT|nr:YccF domain-containing protein [Chitinophaga silvatica]RFS21839.1 YccF domain-containing protein [Chitinophaga silvatica]
MNFIGNIIWLIFGGFISFIQYMLAGFVLCLTIIGIPFGLQCFKIAFFILLPFGREIRHMPSSVGCLSTILNIIWAISAGLGIALTHFFFGLLLTLTIIGIPFARQHFKLMSLAFTPFGKEVH